MVDIVRKALQNQNDAENGADKWAMWIAGEHADFLQLILDNEVTEDIDGASGIARLVDEHQRIILTPLIKSLRDIEKNGMGEYSHEVKDGG